jgi:IMP cyclohydrolase
MSDSLRALEERTYPGRLIIIGRNRGDRIVVVYAVTGRSPSSQARELVLQAGSVWTRPTDADVLAKGNPDLLVYPALVFGLGIAVGNGKQTSDIELAAAPGPIGILEAGLRKWSYEPDEPNFTPRISGCVTPGGSAALNIIRRDRSGEPERLYFEFRTTRGMGRMISTYTGENVHPLPSFRGEPPEVGLKEETARETAEAVYAALGPKPGEPDLRVAVACVSTRPEETQSPDLVILNRRERNPA